MRRQASPAVLLFVCLAGSLACAGVVPVVLPVLLGLGAAGAGVTLARCGAGARPLRRAGLLLVSASLGLALSATLMLRMDLERSAAGLPIQVDEITSMKGWLRQDSLLSRDGDTLLSVRLAAVSAGRRDLSAGARSDILVVVSGEWRFSLGEAVLVRGKLVPLAGSLSRQQYGMWVDRGGIASQGFSSPVWAWRSATREAIHRSISRVGWPASGLLEALMIGSREEVPAALREGFRRTGSLHVLALSGLHAGILYALAMLLFRPLPGRIARFAAGTLFLAAYQLVAGFSPSLVRATTMIVVGGVGFLLDRDPEPLNLLAIAGIAILAADPFQVSSLSFQLSFLALAGILAIGPAVARPLAGRVPPAILQPLAASVGAQLATLPVMLATFGEYFPSGIIAALPLVPLVAVVLTAGLAWIAVFPLAGSALAAAGVAVFGALYAVIDSVTGLLARLPGLTVGPVAATGAAIAAAAVAAGVGLLAPLPGPGARA